MKYNPLRLLPLLLRVRLGMKVDSNLIQELKSTEDRLALAQTILTHKKGSVLGIFEKAKLEAIANEAEIAYELEMLQNHMGTLQQTIATLVTQQIAAKRTIIKLEELV